MTETELNVNIENVYEGPMDLLLDLIKKNKIDIYDIPIAELTEEFIQEMGAISYVNIESFLEFSYMAATLLQIKSRILLPKEEEEEEEDPRDKLVERILEYNYFKYISRLIESDYRVGHKRILKKREDLTILAMNENIGYKEMRVSSLVNVVERFLRKKIIRENRYDFEIEEDPLTLEEGINILNRKISKNENFYFSSLFGKEKSKLEIVTFFLALLELTRIGRISLNQEGNEDILIAGIK